MSYSVGNLKKFNDGLVAIENSLKIYLKVNKGCECINFYNSKIQTLKFAVIFSKIKQ